MQPLFRRLLYLIRQRQMDADLAEELEFHRRLKQAELERTGLPANDAESVSRRILGNQTLAREDAREIWIARWLDSFWRDLVQAGRSLRRSAGFTTVAVLILAVGIGSMTAMFSVLDGVVLRPLNYPGASRIVAIANRYNDNSTPQLAGGDEIDIHSSTAGVFDAMAYYYGGEMGIQLADHAEFVGVRRVHPDFFRVFGVTPIAGRSFTVDDAQRSAIVSVAFARRNFADPAKALRQSVFVENRAYEIVGVMPAEMRFPVNTDVWAADPVLPGNRNRTGHLYRVVARLAAGVSVDAANAHLATVASRLAAEFPENNRGKTFVAAGLSDSLVVAVRPTLYALTGATVLVLLIACANVANLMLARAVGRSREMAVRAALGAARRHIVRQLLFESLVIGAVACGLGLILAYAGTELLLRLGQSYVPLPRLTDVQVNERVLLFSVVISLLTSAVFGSAPAVRACRTDLTAALNQSGRRTLLGTSRGMFGGLVVAQIALSYVLAINAGLLFRSFVSLTGAPLGFEAGGVLVMYAHAPAKGALFDTASLNNYLGVGQSFDDTLAGLRQIPGVTSVGAAMGLPTGQYDSRGSYAIEGQHTFTGDLRRLPSAGLRLASPEYFETLGIPLVRGRTFMDRDVYSQPYVAIVSQSLARQAFGDENPIGHRIMCGFDLPMEWMTIVGVVGDVRQASPASPPGPELYMPLRQHPYAANEIQVVIRAGVVPESLIPTVQETVRSVNSQVAMKFITLESSISQSVATPRFRMTLVSSFASVALLLAVAGVYAVMSYTTAQRVSEFGLRVALGARPVQIVGLVLARAGQLATAGVAVGLALSLATSRVVATALFGVTAADIPTYVGVLSLALPLIVAAAAVPAFRAARTDPATVLRSE